MQLKHSDIWRAIDKLAEKNGLSPSGLAKKAGLSPTVFNASKRTTSSRKRWPSTESIAFILRATGASLDEFVALAASEKTAQTTLPLCTWSAAQKDSAYDEDGKPAGKEWTEIRFPSIADPEAFVLEIEGKGYEPLYREGDRLILSPAEKARRGDRIVIRLKTGKLTLGQLVRESAKSIEITTLDKAAAAFSLPLRDVEWAYRIVWVSQ